MRNPLKRIAQKPTPAEERELELHALLLERMAAVVADLTIPANQVALLVAETRRWTTPDIAPSQRLAALVAVVEHGPRKTARQQACDDIQALLAGEGKAP